MFLFQPLLHRRHAAAWWQFIFCIFQNAHNLWLFCLSTAIPPSDTFVPRIKSACHQLLLFLLYVKNANLKWKGSVPHPYVCSFRTFSFWDFLNICAALYHSFDEQHNTEIKTTAESQLRIFTHHPSEVQAFTRPAPKKDEGPQGRNLLNFQFHYLSRHKKASLSQGKQHSFGKSSIKTQARTPHSSFPVLVLLPENCSRTCNASHSQLYDR